MTFLSDVRAAYEASAEGWANGPDAIYAVLGNALLDDSPVPLAGRRLLDVGAGTGAVSRAAQHRGAEVVGVDLALGMLALDAGRRPPAVVADAHRLPFAADAFDAVVGGFCLNHSPEPTSMLAESARVVRPGGVVLMSVFADDVGDSVKEVIATSLTRQGWLAPDWYRQLKSTVQPAVATPERMRTPAQAAGLVDVTATDRVVDCGNVTSDAVLDWRLGTPHVAPFLRALPADRRAAVVADVRTAIGSGPHRLRLAVVFLSARVAA